MRDDRRAPAENATAPNPPPTSRQRLMIISELWAPRPSTPKTFTQRRQADEKPLFVRSGKIHSRSEEAGRHRAVGLRERLPGGGGTERGHGAGRPKKRRHPRAALAS